MSNKILKSSSEPARSLWRHAWASSCSRLSATGRQLSRRRALGPLMQRRRPRGPRPVQPSFSYVVRRAAPWLVPTVPPTEHGCLAHPCGYSQLQGCHFLMAALGPSSFPPEAAFTLRKAGVHPTRGSQGLSVCAGAISDVLSQDSSAPSSTALQSHRCGAQTGLDPAGSLLPSPRVTCLRAVLCPPGWVLAPSYFLRLVG